jgi:hypothetical protein
MVTTQAACYVSNIIRNNVLARVGMIGIQTLPAWGQTSRPRL